MRQNWHHLLFLHWEVPADQLRRLVPSGLELDLFEGKAYVGLIPFTMTGVRPVGTPPLPWVSQSHESNVRTYVHVAGRDPGVWFFSLDASNSLAVLGARTVFHLPYFHARMEVTTDRTSQGAQPSAISYVSERRRPGPVPAKHAIRAASKGPVTPAAVGTLEHFLVERYILYAATRNQLYRGQIHHAPYPLQTAEVLALEESLVTAAGLTRPDTPPLAHYARNVRVEVFALERL